MSDRKAPTSFRDEPIIAALGEEVRGPLSDLRRIFHDYDIGSAVGCVYCAEMFGGLGVLWETSSLPSPESTSSASPDDGGRR